MFSVLLYPLAEGCPVCMLPRGWKVVGLNTVMYGAYRSLI